MNKEDIAWVGVRVVGVICTIEFLSYLYSLTVVIMSLSSLNEAAEYRESAAMLLESRWLELGSMALVTTIFGVAAVYCLFRGSLVHRLLMRPEKAPNA